LPLCANCSRAYDEGAAVCPHCGATTAPPRPGGTSDSRGARLAGGGLGCLASILVTALDVYILAATNPTLGGSGSLGLYLALQFGAMIALIWFCAWALRRGVSPAMRAGLLMFTIFTAIALGLVGSCTALFTGARFN